MPSTLKLSQETVQRLAPDAGAIKTARDLVRKKCFQDLAVSSDGTWLLADCKGSAVYHVSVDLVNESAPVGRCSCPSRKFPCKHVLGLMLCYVENSEGFAEREPPEDLVAKRDKQVTRASQPPKEKAARKTNMAALAKKTTAQREGLDLLEKLVIDLVAAGQWYEPTRLERLERQAKQMSDAYLPGTQVILRRLVLTGQNPELSDEERTALASDLVARLWATVHKGRNYLDGKLAGEENQDQADAVMEEVLGRAWQFAELREKGYVLTGLHLLELAYERWDDPARQEKIETSHLVDLTTGKVYQSIAFRPYRGLNKIAGQPSFPQPLLLKEAMVYPGFLNRRIRWEPAAEQSEPLAPSHLQRAYDLGSVTLDSVLSAFRQQLKHPLAPREGVVLFRPAKIGRIEDRIFMEDSQGSRLEARDRSTQAANVANLVRAAGMLRNPALLLRLHVGPLTNCLVAEPLAAVTPQTHLRLGL